MRSTPLLTIAVLFAGNAVAQNPQLNFWYTEGCHDNYAGTDYPGNGAIQGGPYGSRAASFVNSGSFPCGTKNPGKFRVFICGDERCEADDRTQVNVGTCVDYYSSVYGMWDCDG